MKFKEYFSNKLNESNRLSNKDLKALKSWENDNWDGNGDKEHVTDVGDILMDGIDTYETMIYDETDEEYNVSKQDIEKVRELGEWFIKEYGWINLNILLRIIHQNVS